MLISYVFFPTSAEMINAYIILWVSVCLCVYVGFGD